MDHIFLSYSREDTAIMRRVRDDLRAEGLKVWTDENLEPGLRSWQIAIERALDAASCLVVILTPSSKQSPWVREEMNYAELQDVRIFPILARGTERNAVPFGFITAQWVDIREDVHYASELQKLIFTIRVHLGLQEIGKSITTKIEPVRITNEPPPVVSAPSVSTPANLPQEKPSSKPSRQFTPDIVKAVMVLQNRESKWWRRVDALTQLGSLGDPMVLPVLRAYLEDADVDVRRAAQMGISRITGETVEVPLGGVVTIEPKPATQEMNKLETQEAETPEFVLAHPSKNSLSNLKLVVTALTDTLRTQFIRAISEIEPVTIDRHIDGSEGEFASKVSMTFGKMSVSDDLPIYLFGMPVQKQFDFMWKVLGEGTLGFIFVVDSTEPHTFGEARAIFEAFREHANVPYVIAADHYDHPGALALELLRVILRLDADDKVLPVNSHDSASVRNCLLELTYLVLEEMES
ncbi:MAG: TIR domain-containing protein [bacterium]|nr:TIR domain-containing protein [bacterium]